MSTAKTVWICGPFGKMGTTLREAIAATDDIVITGVVSPEHVGSSCEAGDAILNTYDSLDALRADVEFADVVIDFTVADVCYEHALYAAANSIDFVTGTTGLNANQKEEIENAFAKSSANAIIASNFSVGAVLMMHFAAVAAQHFENAEIVETHHTRKKDAPSGTALTTQEMMVQASDMTESDIPIHSLRLPGAVAHQQVHLSSQGEILRIEHDANDRTCFMPGVLLSIRSIENVHGVLYSIESLLFPQDS